MNVMNYRNRKFIKDTVNNFVDWYRVKCRKKDWIEFATKNLKQSSLTSKEVKRVEDFYKPYCKVNPIFFDFYKEKTGDFDEKFIPDDIYYGYIDPYFNDWSAAVFLDNKCYYKNLFANAKQPETVLMRMNGIWFDGARNVIPLRNVNEILKSEQNLFIKIATESDGGHGVRYFENRKDVNMFHEFVESIHSDIIVQRGVIQHERLNKLNSSSVNTIRTLSLLTNKGVKIYSSVLRMGVDGSKVDNESSGGLTCGISANGCLKAIAHNKNGDSCVEHPNSHICFEGYNVPCFEKVLEIIPKLHTQVSLFRLISWDFSINEQGEPVLIEANFRYGGVTMHQLNNGPIFGDDTEKVLKEVFYTSKYRK